MEAGGPILPATDEVVEIEKHALSLVEAGEYNRKAGWRDVVVWPDARLAQPCAEVSAEAIASLSEPGSDLRKLLDDMGRTMRLLDGAGLAAPQVGQNIRACVVLVRPVKAGQEEIVSLINPEIVFASKKQVETEEGCLSLPGAKVLVRRSNCVRVRAIGYDGKPFEIGGDGLLAVALQHEIDHLNGRTIVDAASPLKRQILRRKFQKAKSRGLRYRTPAERLDDAL